jgi:GntR family transcriptional regulator
MTRTPAYRRIARDIKTRIDSGALAGGDRLPSARQLRKQYGVSAQPVKAALIVLETAGYTEGQQGRGVFVVPAHRRGQEVPL